MAAVRPRPTSNPSPTLSARSIAAGPLSSATHQGPWVMAQTWDHLLFAHWPIDPAQLRRVVPSRLDIDTFDGQAWLGVVTFDICRIHLHGLPPTPGLAHFPEVNLRTYVRHHGRRGVLFLSLHCPNRLAMAIARPWFRLPYHYADVHLAERAGQVDFVSHSPAGASFAADYRSTSAPFAADPGSLEHWLTERYCYYTAATDGRLYRCDIDHPQWALTHAGATVHANSLPQQFGLDRGVTPPLLHCGQRTEARIWALRRVA